MPDLLVQSKGFTNLHIACLAVSGKSHWQTWCTVSSIDVVAEPMLLLQILRSLGRCH